MSPPQFFLCSPIPNKSSDDDNLSTVLHNIFLTHSARPFAGDWTLKFFMSDCPSALHENSAQHHAHDLVFTNITDEYHSIPAKSAAIFAYAKEIKAKWCVIIQGCAGVGQLSITVVPCASASIYIFSLSSPTFLFFPSSFFIYCFDPSSSFRFGLNFITR